MAGILIRFLLGFGLFSGAFAVSFREYSLVFRGVIGVIGSCRGVKAFGFVDSTMGFHGGRPDKCHVSLLGCPASTGCNWHYFTIFHPYKGRLDTSRK